MNPDLLAELVDRLGSPLYVYDLDELRRAHQDLSAGLPAHAELLYSLKANPHPAVVEVLGSRGCGAEVSSEGELAAALAAGVAPEHCLYTGPGKTAAEISAALDVGVSWFSADSPRDVKRIGAEAAARGEPCRAILRVNPATGAFGGGLTMTGEASPFGADAAWIASRPDEFAHPYVDVCGFHVFLASNIAEVGALVEAAAVAIATVEPLVGALAGPVELVDLGGGFGHPFARPGARPDLTALRPALTALVDERLVPVVGGARVAFESGRYLAGACGHLVSTVQDVKQSHGRSFAVLDSGIHHLGGMYGLRRVPSLGVEVVHRPGSELDQPGAGTALDGLDGFEGLEGFEGFDGAAGPVDLVGPLCTPLDSWARGSDLASVAAGDLVVVPNVGAYGLTASLLGFLGRPCPTEVVVEGDEIVDVSRLSLERAPVAWSSDRRERWVRQHA